MVGSVGEGSPSFVSSNPQVATAAATGVMQGYVRVKVTKVGPGTCTITASAPETTNFLAASCSFDVACYVMSAVPSQSGTLTYTGEHEEPTWNNYNPLYLDYDGDEYAIDAGEYEVYFTPKPMCTWEDGTSDTKSVYYEISKAPGYLNLEDVYYLNGVDETQVNLDCDETAEITAVSSDPSTISVEGSSYGYITCTPIKRKYVMTGEPTNYELSQATYNINFSIDNGTKYNQIQITNDSEPYTDGSLGHDAGYIQYVNTQTGQSNTAYRYIWYIGEYGSDEGSEYGWTTGCTSITFDTAPDGDLLSFLETWGVEKTYTQVTVTITVGEGDNHEAVPESKTCIVATRRESATSA